MFEKVKLFFAERTQVPADQIQPDSDLTQLGIASLQLLMIICDFENEFNVKISDHQLENVHTIGDIVALVEQSV